LRDGECITTVKRHARRWHSKGSGFIRASAHAIQILQNISSSAKTHKEPLPMKMFFYCPPLILSDW